MKQYVLSLIFILCLGGLFAQRSHHDSKYDEQFEASKIAFITTKLELSSKEAKVFWPVYNKYEDDKRTLWDSFKRRSSKELAQLSGEEARGVLAGMLQYDKAKLEMKQELIDQMSDILPPQKVAMLFVVEREFRKELIANMKIKKPDK